MKKSHNNWQTSEKKSLTNKKKVTGKNSDTMSQTGKKNSHKNDKLK